MRARAPPAVLHSPPPARGILAHGTVLQWAGTAMLSHLRAPGAAAGRCTLWVSPASAPGYPQSARVQWPPSSLRDPQARRRSSMRSMHQGVCMHVCRCLLLGLRLACSVVWLVVARLLVAVWAARSALHSSSCIGRPCPCDDPSGAQERREDVRGLAPARGALPRSRQRTTAQCR